MFYKNRTFFNITIYTLVLYDFNSYIYLGYLLCNAYFNDESSEIFLICLVSFKKSLHLARKKTLSVFHPSTAIVLKVFHIFSYYPFQAKSPLNNVHSNNLIYFPEN